MGAGGALLSRRTSISISLVTASSSALRFSSSGITLALELLDVLFEFSLVGVDLLFKQNGPFLQFPANVTHCLPFVR